MMSTTARSSAFVQAAFVVERAIVIRRGALPILQPEVDSAVVVLVPRADRASQKLWLFARS